MRVLHVGDDFSALRPCGLTHYSDALMHAQTADGHDVAYVFSGRKYPRLKRPRLKRWQLGDVTMYELLGGPFNSHWEHGTRYPLRDLEEPSGEAAFAAAVREASPDVVHIHDLSRLPSSLIERAKDDGLPVVMTLHDYKPICAAVRLLDADGRRCIRREVGEDCARNCAGAPDGDAHLVRLTLEYERRRLRRLSPFGARIDLTKFGPLIWATTPKLRSSALPASEAPAVAARPAEAASPAAYQRRRDVNVVRLSLCDRLIAPSHRVAEIYGELGVDAERIVVQRLALPHLERLAPGRSAGVRPPVTFVTLGGCTSRAKGSAAVLEAVGALDAAGRGDDYRLLVAGLVEPAAREELSRIPSVSLAGPYTSADLDGLLDGADVGVMPSIWEETHGFTGVEMLAKGLPVIGSALGGIVEYVRQGETGWLNRSGTGSELAELMAKAMDDPGEVERLRRSVRSLRPELVRPMGDHVAEVQDLYDELTASLPATA